jgi:hypothetical protein
MSGKENLGCKEEVALRMAIMIAQQESLNGTSKNYREEFLDLYARCLYATNGLRDFDD